MRGCVSAQIISLNFPVAINHPLYGGRIGSVGATIGRPPYDRPEGNKGSPGGQHGIPRRAYTQKRFITYVQI